MQVVDRYLEEYAVGEVRRTLGRTITEADVVLHAGQTGDFFPHHMDERWCVQEAGLAGRIAHGTLILSVAVGMTAGDVNPQAMSYGYDRIRFIKPVFLGDTITVEAEIVEVADHPRRPELGRVDERVTVTNHDGDTVLSLVHLYVVNKRGERP
ncbi:MaoC family dehydratase [Occultella kanbiaonis]|uniref:MaoC family dehydratase n=1 Tax=Occultella kanbiaonis TaxID=2675754 RepID=UPI0012B8DDD3|nr:MaoC/PaaZ C-terminal domain-containing protein [Occultella kanbiaonis]